MAAIDPLSAFSSNPSSQASSASGSTGASKDQFLKLLIAQLQHQDPLQPQDNSAFVAELAQFSALEQQAQTNQQLSDIAAGQVAAQRASYAGFIGKNITAKSSTVTLDGVTPPTLKQHLDSASASTQLVVTDAAGNVVATRELGPVAAGDVPLVWDGKDEKGKWVAAGKYTMSLTAKDAKGGALSGYVAVAGVISGLQFSASGTTFLVGGASVSPSDIVSITN